MLNDNSDAKQRSLESIEAQRVTNDVAKYCVDGVEPQIGVSPISVDEIVTVVKTASEESLGIVPFGGGTRICLGNPLSGSYGIALNMRSMNRIVTHNAGDLTATVESGITLKELSDVLYDHGQFLALDAPLLSKATIGGTLAAGAIGPLKWQFGSPRDLVVGMQVVQSHGKLVKSGGRVVKNVSGYDMARLHIGGLGSLGVITEVSFKLSPLPQVQKNLVITFKQLEHSISSGLDIANTEIMPLSMMSFDRTVNHTAGLGLSTSEGYLAIRLGGRPRTLNRQLQECIKICENYEAVEFLELDEQATYTFWRLLVDYKWESEVENPIARISVAPDQIYPMIKNMLVQDKPDFLSFLTEPGYGSMIVHWSDEGYDDFEEAVIISMEKSRDMAVNLGGHFIIERAPENIKSNLDPWGKVGGSIEIMRRMKQEYDPANIFNVGRFVGGI
tara:strand:+ start:8232 stop:9566 length:1335 start_codon:yes stop_codon:yes gene_type:complete